MLSNGEWFIEYNIGWKLCKYIDIPINNSCPHRFKPQKIYEEIWNVINHHQIPAEILIEGKVKNIYQFIVQKDFQKSEYPKYCRMHDRVFPNYMKSFNFKVYYNLLPVKRLFREYGLDNDSRCNFCNLNPDTHSHLFSQCKMLENVWKFIDEILGLINISPNVYSIMEKRKSYDYDIVNTRIKRCTKEQEKILYI